VLKVDDPCGAISVHGYCGLLGGLCLGLFADGTYGDGWNNVPGKVTGLLYVDSKQFICQLIGMAVCVIWAFGATFVVFKIVNSIKSMRVTPEVELEGLDVPEFGGLAYPDDVIAAPDHASGMLPHGTAASVAHPMQAPST